MGECLEREGDHICRNRLGHPVASAHRCLCGEEWPTGPTWTVAIFRTTSAEAAILLTPSTWGEAYKYVQELLSWRRALEEAGPDGCLACIEQAKTLAERISEVDAGTTLLGIGIHDDVLSILRVP